MKSLPFLKVPAISKEVCKFISFGVGGLCSGVHVEKLTTRTSRLRAFAGTRPLHRLRQTETFRDNSSCPFRTPGNHEKQHHDHPPFPKGGRGDFADCLRAFRNREDSGPSIWRLPTVVSTVFSARRFAFPAAMFLSVVLAAGCAVGPDFKTPDAPKVSGYTQQLLPDKTVSAPVQGGEPQRWVRDMDISGQWWTLFQSKPLNDLIEHALKANPDVDGAQAALRVAWENVYAQRGALLPSVDAEYNASRQRVAGTLSSPLSNGTNIFNLHTLQVNVAYTLDVFGGTRRQVESLAAQADSQRFQVEATYLTLTSNVVASAVQEAGLRGQIAATKHIIDIQTHSLDLLRRQFALGQVAKADVVAQEATLAQTRATLPPLEKQLAQQRDLLARLVGSFPSETPSQEFELASLHLPEDLPVSLPSRLVEQRPDVRSAEGQLHAASADIGAAIANRLPNITLSANAGESAASIASLFTPGTGFWTLAGGVAQPVFHGGTLLHKQRAAEAAYDQALAQYRGTVLTAFQNVADSLHAVQSDADALAAAVAAEQAASTSLEIARRQLELGDISYLSLLNAEQTYQQASINLVQALANRYADTAALFAALGGGWWNRTDIAAGIGG